MIDKLKIFLDYEQNVLENLITLAEKQQKALIHYNAIELEQITLTQEDLSKKLRQAEEQRINLLMSWLNISRREAMNMQMSKLEELLAGDARAMITTYKRNFGIITDRLTNLSILNRLLANRAKNSIGELLSFLTNGSNHVCNVKI